MFLPFLETLRRHGVPVSLREHLTFLAGLGAGLGRGTPEALYHFARTALVKDERHLDRFDRAFAECFGGLDALPASLALAVEGVDLPPDWLEKLLEGRLTAAEKAAVAALGRPERLLEALGRRLAEQRGRHQGGAKWMGTAGTSPFGAWGYNPEGLRIGQDRGRERRAVKVWDRREFRNLDGEAGLGTRNLRVALRRLRAWAREGAAEELDLDGTIGATARAGWLDLRTRPERRNAVRVLLFLDAGGSMDAHVRAAEALFAAARAEFRNLEVWYFHNCLYDHVWRDNRRRHDDRTPTDHLLRSHGPAWRAVFVGDAEMSPYEITHPGGAVEQWNREPGAVWLARALAQWPRAAWLNPVPEAAWDATPSVGLIRGIFGGRMYPLTPDGIAAATRAMR
ncbi:MAG: VWA domain-containing protein [Rhodobacteraceae bacterium]|nr:VWA domain-containing protein [Paracoccaceae bacterium]